MAKTEYETVRDKYLGKHVQIVNEAGDVLLEGTVLKVTRDFKLIGTWSKDELDSISVDKLN